MSRPPPTSTLFPYTTLFRSRQAPHLVLGHQSQALVEILLRIDGDEVARGDLADRRALRVTPLRDRADGDVAVCDRAPKLVARSEEHTSELQSRLHLVCRLLL